MLLVSHNTQYLSSIISYPLLELVPELMNDVNYPQIVLEKKERKKIIITRFDVMVFRDIYTITCSNKKQIIIINHYDVVMWRDFCA